MRLALEHGYQRIELALIHSFDPDSCRDDAWRHNDPPPIPPMNVAQALQLLYLHQKEARLWGERPDRRRRRGESGDQWSARLGRKWRAEKAWDREGYEVVAAICEGGEAPAHLELPAPVLPALDQVTGWSKARERPEDAEESARPALFGGQRCRRQRGGHWPGSLWVAANGRRLTRRARSRNSLQNFTLIHICIRNYFITDPICRPEPRRRR
jgi:hypothetical protein